MSLNNEFYAPQNYEPDIKRAYHNLSEKNSFTPQTGLNFPVYHRFCYAGDDFEINTGTLLQTIVPMNRPLLDCFELRLEYYFEPLRNLYGYMSNNSKETTTDILENSPKWCVRLFGVDENDQTIGLLGRGLGVVGQVVPPFAGNSYSTVIEKNSLIEHFGVPVGWQGFESVDDSLSPGGGFPNADVKYASSEIGNVVNIEALLAYLDICRTYHLNTQLDTAYFLTGGPYSNQGSDGFNINSIWSTVPVKLIDDLFVELRYLSKSRNFDSIIDRRIDPNDSYLNFLYRWLASSTQTMGGFFPVQYRPDMWRNLLSRTESYNVRVSTTGGSFAMEELYQKNKIKKLADSVLYGGGRFKNLLRTVFGWKSDLDLDIPVLRAVQKHIIDPSNITAMATTVNSSGEDTSLGQKAANVDRYNSSPKPVRIKCDEPGYIIVVANITPLVGYSQGFDPFILRTSHNDDWTPQMNNLSHQDIPQLLYSAYPEYDIYDDEGADESVLDNSPLNVVGKQVAWVEERTAVGHQHGEFNEYNGDYRDMVLGRKYSILWQNEANGVTNYFSRFFLSPYVNPLEYNDIFAMNNLITPPWSLHCAFNIKALRPIGKHYKPSLE